MEELERGLAIAAGAALWAVATWVALLAVELAWTLWLRRQLTAAGRPRLGATLGLIGGLLVVVPALGGYAGCVAAAQRSQAEAAEHVSPGVVEAMIDGALHAAATERLGPDYDDALPLDEAALHATARARPAVRPGLAGRFDAIVDEVIATAPAPRTWRDVVTQARPTLGPAFRAELRAYGQELRTRARSTLLLALALALGANGVAYGLVRRATAAASASR